MASSKPPASGPTCTRCRQSLSTGSTFCVACGFNNGREDLARNQLSIGQQLERRNEERSFWRNLIGLRWVSR